MNTLLKFASVSLLGFSGSLFAHDFDSCKIVEVVAAGAQNGHIQLDCVVKNAPACAGAPSFVGFDKSTEEGKQYLSIALAAFATNANVSGNVDKNACSPHQGNVPLLQHLRLKK